MPGPGLGPNAPPATIYGALMYTVTANAAMASATIATGTSIQRGRPPPLTLTPSSKKPPRPREARAARVGGKRRPVRSLAGGDPATFKTPCASFGSDAGATWGRLWVRFSRFLSMIFFHPTAEPVSRAHGCKSARPTAGKARAHCLLQMQNIHGRHRRMLRDAGRANDLRPTYAINIARIEHAPAR